MMAPASLGKNEDPQVRQLLHKPPQDFDAVETRQFRIQDRNVGLYVKAKLDRLVSLAGFAHKLVVVVEPKNLNEHLADGGLVFYDDEAFHGGRKGWWVGRDSNPEPTT